MISRLARDIGASWYRLSSLEITYTRLASFMHHQLPFRYATAVLSRSVRVSWTCRACKRNLSSTALRHAVANTQSPKPFYVTTPIFYVNAAPHVGHLYSMVLGDILKRYAELRGEKAFLLTGTDEHGMKVQRAAEKADTEPKAFCDQGANIFKVHTTHCIHHVPADCPRIWQLAPIYHTLDSCERQM